jgi:hypothetical protein
MRALACAAVVIALGTSACASSHARSDPSTTKTDAIQLHASGYNSLAPPLRNFVRSIIAAPSDGPINEIDVYGPGSRAALVKASSGDIVVMSPREARQRFYLIVARGQFVCDGCSGPAGHKPPHGTVETRVWSRAEGGTDFGIGGGLPAAVSRLHRLAVIKLS